MTSFSPLSTDEVWSRERLSLLAELFLQILREHDTFRHSMRMAANAAYMCLSGYVLIDGAHAGIAPHPLPSFWRAQPKTYFGQELPDVLTYNKKMRRVEAPVAVLKLALIHFIRQFNAKAMLFQRTYLLAAEAANDNGSFAQQRATFRAIYDQAVIFHFPQLAQFVPSDRDELMAALTGGLHETQENTAMLPSRNDLTDWDIWQDAMNTLCFSGMLLRYYLQDTWGFTTP